MKVNRTEPINDPCETSISFLVERCESFFRSHPELDSKVRFYPEDPRYQDLKEPESGPVDVILFGNGFKSILSSGNWIGSNLRIWVLSRAMKDFLEKEFFHKRDSVNLIPRHEILEFSDRAIQGEGPQQFIYAGRLSSQKNIRLLLHAISHLQRISGEGIELHLFGAADESHHENFGRRHHKGYGESLNNLATKLPFVTPPIFHGKVGFEEWIEHPWKNPVFISLSTFICEDFGVSLSQALAKGWPAIISNFGGHKDINSEKVLFIDYQFCGYDHMSEDHLALLGERIANRILEESLTSYERENEPFSNHTLDLSFVDQKRRELSKKLGSLILESGFEYMDSFADHALGRDYLNIFLGYQTGLEKKYSLVTYDFENSPPSQSELKIFYKELDQSDEGIEPHFIGSKDLFLKDNIRLLMTSEKILLIPYEGKEENWLSFLVDKLHIPESRIKILCKSE